MSKWKRKPKALREFEPTLKRNGFVLARSKGDHFIYINRTTGRHVSVSKDVNEMIKQRLIKENQMVV